MNGYVGPQDNAGTPVDQGWAQFIKLSDIRTPSMIFVFLDESPQTINDGWYIFCNDNPAGNLWSDMPASYHNRACGFSFADGHSEIHKFKSQLCTILPVTYGPFPTPSLTSDPAAVQDATWVAMRASVPMR